MRGSVLTISLTILIVLCIGLSPSYGQEKREPRTQQSIGSINMSRSLMRLMDMDSDGEVTGGEYMKFFAKADQDGNGSIDQKELIILINKERQERVAAARRQEVGGPDVGQKAPDFNLRRLHGEGSVKLSDVIGEKPIVLVFGSYT